MIAGAKLWEHAYYGAWIPNSVTAKRDLDVGPVESLHRSLTPGWHYVQSSLGASWLVFAVATLAALVLGGAIRRRLQPGPYTGPLVATAFGLAIAVASRGDWMPYGRLLQPYLPVALACLASGAVVVLRRATTSGVGIALAVAAWSLTGLLLEPDPGVVVQRFREPVLDNLGRLLRERGEPRDLYAIGVAGRIGYYARPRTVLDVFGLTSPAIARRQIAGTMFGKFVPDEVTKWRPVLIMQNYWPQIQTLLNGTRDRYDLLVTPIAPRAFYIAVRHDRLSEWKRPLERTYDGHVVEPAVGFAKWRAAAPTGA
ncbi:MAG: hypothetical protein E6G30_05360 [Actinobacteria bacterium]|nr:MAG: hypothetical protein E6G30_05360 [Actinomycetota bacterium]